MYKVKTPGSLMLFGEHAVLNSKPAIVCAIDKYIEVELIPNTNDDNRLLWKKPCSSLKMEVPVGCNDEKVLIKIESNLGEAEFSLSNLSTALKNMQPDLSTENVYPNLSSSGSDILSSCSSDISSSCGKTAGSIPNNLKKFAYVIAAIKLFESKINTSFTLKINSEFSATVGFGSSAAVTVSVISVLYRWLYQNELNKNDLLELSKEVVLNVAGVGSGADLAASIFGGVVFYQKDSNNLSLIIENLPLIPNIIAFYCGYKTKTKDVIKIVNDKSKVNLTFYKNLYELMGMTVTQAKKAIFEQDYKTLGILMNMYHGLLASLGVSDVVLDDIAHNLRENLNIIGAKISGAGLGDCVIGLEKKENIEFNENKEKALLEKKYLCKNMVELLKKYSKSEFFSLNVSECGCKFYVEKKIS